MRLVPSTVSVPTSTVRPEGNVVPGDVAYAYMPGPVDPKGSYAGSSTTEYAEIIYFYDRKARSSGVNLFGIMTEGKEEFCAASHSIRPQGPIRILMRELEEEQNVGSVD